MNQTWQTELRILVSLFAFLPKILTFLGCSRQKRGGGEVGGEMSNTGFGEEPPLCAFRKLGKFLLALILHYALLTFSLAPCITLLLFFTSLSAISNQYSAFTKEVCNFRQKTGYCIFIPALPLTSFCDLRQAQSFSGPHTSDLYNEYNIYGKSYHKH